MKTFDQASIVKCHHLHSLHANGTSKVILSNMARGGGDSVFTYFSEKTKIQIHYDVKWANLKTLLEAMRASQIMLNNG
ncbi:hypothetical protein MSP8887_03129 [Marinomonas spartinae]|uniref:hypothetical protein n=1 Tax=Marinomonas spartinae TaxID=1792290 RepID=UPI000808D115|nr:hypothetical protein [Marinomonas spartinae]SBS38049.1 hypothetical protein MSP8887_03129 [Marinomonas spartinae]